MFSTTSGPCRSRRTNPPFNSGRRHRVDFARQITIAEFGWRFAKSLDQTNFVDRAPGAAPRPSPEARQ